MNSSLNSKWNKCLEIIRDNVSEATFTTWFADITPLRYEGNTLTIQVKSNFVYEFLEGNYVDLLRSTLFKVMGNGTQLMYSILTDKDNNLSVEVSTDSSNQRNGGSRNSGNSAPKSMQEVVQELDSMLINRYTFDNYVEGISNRLSRSVAMSVADKPGRAFNPLFIHGSSGVGKTHLINAIGVKIKELHPELRVLYVSAHLFQVQYTDSILQKNFNDFMRFYQSIDVLIIDDIQEFAGLQKTQNAFFHIFNHLHLNGKQLIMTSDRSPMQLKGMEERLITRFKWGLTAEIERPNIELRRNILANKVRRENIVLSPDVLEYIAANVTDSVRELEGILISLMAHSTIYGREIDLPMAERVISKAVRIEEKEVTVEDIVHNTCEHYHLKDESIYTNSRKRDIVQARQIAMYLTHKHLPNLSLARIGQQIGSRDHSTVLHACRTIEEQLAVNKVLQSAVEEIESKIKIKP